MSEWVYIESERTSEYVLYTVGFYGPNDKWQPDSDHSNREAAAERVSFLNGKAQPAASVVPPWQPIETAPKDGTVDGGFITSQSVEANLLYEILMQLKSLAEIGKAQQG